MQKGEVFRGRECPTPMSGPSIAARTGSARPESPDLRSPYLGSSFQIARTSLLLMRPGYLCPFEGI